MTDTRNRFYLIMIATSLVMIGVLAWVLLEDRSRGLEISAETTRISAVIADQQVTLTAFASYTPPPTPTIAPTVTPTPLHLATVQAEGTAIRTQNLDALAQSASQWETVFTEDFQNNDLNWSEDSGSDELSIAERMVTGGSYVWEVEAIDDFWWLESYGAVEFEDFLFSAELTQQFHAVGEQGLLFRYVDASNFYYFKLCDDRQSYQAGRRVDGEWLALLGCLTSSHINTDASNTLTVVARDNHFLFAINDKYVNEMYDSRIVGGGIGVFIEMLAKEQNSYTWRNLNVKTP